MQDFMVKTNFFCGTLPFSLWAFFSHVVAYKSSSKNTRKMNMQPVLNKNIPWIHVQSKFDVLGVAKELVKYVVHLSKELKYLKLFFFLQGVQTTNYQLKEF
jgi:hypothetical protein